jgi:predicted Fe-Mo cluster-binding NifX family protein
MSLHSTPAHQHHHARITARVAVATDDGLTVRETFAGAAYYAVLTVYESDIIHSELREAPPLGHAADLDRAIGVLRDCQVALARSMDDNTRSALQRAGIQPFATPVDLVEDAMDRFVLDTLAEMGR